MSNSKRVCVYNDAHSLVVTPDPKGKFVKYEDYQALEDLLEEAWDAGYENGSEEQRGYLKTISFNQWKERHLK